MDKQELQPLKGFRDFLPADAQKRQYALAIIRQTFQNFGFEPLETPALERQSLLLGKYGAEADKLVYKFQDEGKRKVGLRYDQTVPTARVIAAFRENLGLPFKRFQIQPVWRAEKPQKGRFREFLQCDIDTFGTTSPLSDAEIIATSIASLKNLGFSNIKMLLNSRQILFDLINKAQIPPDQALSTIQSIDKLDKLSPQKVKDELKSKGLDASQINSLFQFIDQAQPSPEIQEIIKNCIDLGVNKNQLEFVPILARGLDYYTGTIFELKSTDYPSGSLAGGGRYDKLIGELSGLDIPAVGIALGFDRIIDAMEELKLFPNQLSSAKVLVTIFNSSLQQPALQLASKLRAKNIPTLLYLNPKDKMQKQLKYANKKKVPFVVIIGEEEVKDNTYTLKNMQTGTQGKFNFDQLLSQLES